MKVSLIPQLSCLKAMPFLLRVLVKFNSAYLMVRNDIYIALSTR